MAKTNEFTVISLGGSIIVPHLSDSDGIAVSFLRAFRSFLLQEFKTGKRFIIIPGGGKTARVYQKAGRQVGKMSNEDLDWIGIHATRLNAHLLRTIFQKQAYPWVIDEEPSLSMVKKLKNSKKRLFIASGWKPGRSTDYDAVQLAKKFGAKQVVNASNIAFVYSEDPKKNGKAKPIKELSWKQYKKLIPATWTPGMSAPFDPIATRVAEKLKLEVKIIKGKDLKNLKKAVEGKPFTGTLIS
ncbi:MAG: UMP kinase [bacterium]|nr:UMP kinase [bacterium]